MFPVFMFSHLYIFSPYISSLVFTAHILCVPASQVSNVPLYILQSVHGLPVHIFQFAHVFYMFQSVHIVTSFYLVGLIIFHIYLITVLFFQSNPWLSMSNSNFISLYFQYLSFHVFMFPVLIFTFPVHVFYSFSVPVYSHVCLSYLHFISHFHVSIFDFYLIE